MKPHQISKWTKSDRLRNAGISVFAVKHFMTMICDTTWLAHITCEILQGQCNFTFTSAKMNSVQCSITALIHSNLQLFSPRKNDCEARCFIQNAPQIQKKCQWSQHMRKSLEVKSYSSQMSKQMARHLSRCQYQPFGKTKPLSGY